MTNEEIIEGNRLIAEFMGWTTHPKHGENYVINKSKYRKVPYWSDCSYKAMREILDYYNSWDWLMPVVEKIKQLEIVDFTKKKPIMNALIDIDINVLYNSVVEFIKWYNKQLN